MEKFAGFVMCFRSEPEQSLTLCVSCFKSNLLLWNCHCVLIMGWLGTGGHFL